MLSAITALAVYMFFKKGEFVSALKGEIRMSPAFYITALSVVFASSIVYAPFSFGVSKYFINAKTKSQRIKDVFYLFKTPRVLFKAVLADSLKKLVIAAYRIVVLLFAVVFECVLFACVAYFRTNAFEKSISDVVKKASYAATSGVFIAVTVVAWAVVLTIFFYIKIKYILCKYALILNPELSALQSIKIGRRAAYGKVNKMIRYYIKYVAIYVFTFFTRGFLPPKH